MVNRWILPAIVVALVAGGLVHWALAPRSAPQGPPTPATSVPEAPLGSPVVAPAADPDPPAPTPVPLGPVPEAPGLRALVEREPTAEVPAPIPLEDLLRLPAPDPAAPQSLEVDRNPHLRVPRDGVESQAAGSSIRDRVRVEHREERVGRPGPGERTVGQTDTHVRVPVKDSVEVRGGVRIESERAGDGELEDAEAGPSVGVDVRF